jgi:tRNA 2-thiocytidine biosynthesis protein TtcA
MGRESYFLKNFRSTVGKAINDFNLIQKNDRILVGFSGGKDSIALFDILNSRKKFVPVNYELIPLFVYNGEYVDTIKEVENFFRNFYNLSAIIKTVNISEFVKSGKNNENPCFICSRIRRKIFFDTAYELKCNKLALGHNMDDMNETLLLNIFYSGNISTMLPKQVLFDGDLTIIRPLIYLLENQILKYVKTLDLPVIEKKCSYRGKSRQREKIKRIINELYEDNKKVKKNIANSVRNVNADYLWQNIEKGDK